ncbi:hypothetical protein IC582_015432 [Cucumis melo]|uniref:Uncharacterized protein n=1 Tax=Cucumis melo TaxID=3656 RepID=A0A9I9EE86_CUCME
MCLSLTLVMVVVIQFILVLHLFNYIPDRPLICMVLISMGIGFPLVMARGMDLIFLVLGC